MIIENINELKTWLNTCLSAITDADPATLARYVLALLKKDKPLAELREVCLSQLDVFLKDHTVGFVNKLMHTLDTKSYLNESTANAIQTNTVVSSTTIKQSVTADERRENRKPASSRGMRSRSPATSRRRSPTLHSSRHRSSSRSPVRSRLRGSRSPAGRRRSRSHSSDRRTRSKVTTSSRPDHRSRSRSQHRSKSGGRRPSNDDQKPSSKGATGQVKQEPGDSKDKKDMAASKIRCRDYDEKGFCLRGDLCQFDHGVNPVVVDDLSGLTYASAATSVIGPPASQTPAVAQSIRTVFPAGNPGDTLPLRPPLTAIFNPGLPPPGMPLVHLPPPPLRHFQGRTVLPPPPPTDVFQTEAYNPEAPAMQVGPAAWLRPQADSRAPIPPPLATSSPRAAGSQPRFDNRRGNRRPINVEKTTLELRKIPPNLNRMDVLLEHFQTFGTVVNLQICYEGDPEAALVSFATNREAHAAHQSSAPVLNNRFIRVFWHNKPQASPDTAPTSDKLSALPPDNNMVVSVSQTSSVREVRRPGVNLKERVELPAVHQLSLNNVKRKTLAETQANAPATTLDSSTVPTKGSLTRTVINPTAGKQRKLSVTSTDISTAPVTSVAPSGNRALLTSAPPSKKMNPRLKQQESQKLKLELQRRTQQLLEKQLQQQKLLLVKLEKKTLSADDRAVVMKTLKTLSDHVQRLQAELKSAVTPTTLAPPPVKRPRPPAHVIATNVVKELTPKAILDTELDLIHKQYEGADAEELYRKVAELKSEAVSLGLIGPGFKVESQGQGHAPMTESKLRDSNINHAPSKNEPAEEPKERELSADDAEDRDEVLLDAAEDDVDADVASELLS